MADSDIVMSQKWCSISFTDLIQHYANVQSALTLQVKALASNYCTAAPGRFLLVQFQMSQVAQIGDSISNMIAQIMGMINTAVRNQKS